MLIYSLLGLDTNGHAHRPYSKQYLDNIGVVDSGLKKIEKLMNAFYKEDGKTAFVVAADHGMSNRGSHGDGDPQNTETPLVVWGAGVQGPDTITASGHDAQSLSWKMDPWQRNDVGQADVAPLMVPFHPYQIVFSHWGGISNELCRDSTAGLFEEH